MKQLSIICAYCLVFGFMVNTSFASEWAEMDIGTTTDKLFCVWGSSTTDVFTAGSDGTILHYDGIAWSVMDSGTRIDIFGIWGTSAFDVFAVGGHGTILHYNGINWSSRRIPTGDFRAVWGSSHTNVFAVGINGIIYHYNGINWSSMDSGTSTWLYGVWGSSSSDVFAVGNDGIILHYDGKTWTKMESGSTVQLGGVWGSSGSDVFAVGANGTILHYDGSHWSLMDSGPETSGYFAVGGTSASDLYAWGVARVHYNGIEWSDRALVYGFYCFGLWGSPNGDVFAVGKHWDEEDRGAIYRYNSNTDDDGIENEEYNFKGFFSLHGTVWNACWLGVGFPPSIGASCEGPGMAFYQGKVYACDDASFPVYCQQWPYHFYIDFGVVSIVFGVYPFFYELAILQPIGLGYYTRGGCTCWIGLCGCLYLNGIMYKVNNNWTPTDADHDGIWNKNDNCTVVFNPDQTDTDNDGSGDVCDNCPLTPNSTDLGTCIYSWASTETCTTDTDCNGDGTCSRYQDDADRDGIGNVCDNCPYVKNPYQRDKDNDGFGDACDRD